MKLRAHQRLRLEGHIMFLDFITEVLRDEVQSPLMYRALLKHNSAEHAAISIRATFNDVRMNELINPGQEVRSPMNSKHVTFELKAGWLLNGAKKAAELACA